MHQHHSPYAIQHTPFTIHHTPYTIHHTPYTIHHSPFIIRHTPYTIHHTPYAIRHTPFTIHHTPYATHHTPFTIHHTPYTIRHTPFIIRHTPYTIHHTPYTIPMHSLHHTLFTIHHTLPAHPEGGTVFELFRSAFKSGNSTSSSNKSSSNKSNHQRQQGSAKPLPPSEVSAAQAGELVEVRFGNGRVDLNRVRVGDKIWKTADPALMAALREAPPVAVQAAAAAVSARGKTHVQARVSGSVGQPIVVTLEAHASCAGHEQIGVVCGQGSSDALLSEARSKVQWTIDSTPYTISIYTPTPYTIPIHSYTIHHTNTLSQPIDEDTLRGAVGALGGTSLLLQVHTIQYTHHTVYTIQYTPYSIHTIQYTPCTIQYTHHTVYTPYTHYTPCTLH
jgi:hypothetical protein